MNKNTAGKCCNYCSQDVRRRKTPKAPEDSEGSWRLRRLAAHCRWKAAGMWAERSSLLRVKRKILNTPLVLPLPPSLCLYLTAPLVPGEPALLYWLYKCLSLLIWMFYEQSRGESVRWTSSPSLFYFLFFSSGMKANCIFPAINSL